MALSLGPLEGHLDSLSPRDRKLLSAMAIFFGTVFVGGLWWFVLGLVADKNADLARKHDVLELLNVAAEQYRIAEETIAASEERLSQYQGEGFKPFVEKTAKQESVELGSVNSKSSETVGTVKSTLYKVELKKVDLGNALDFLNALETSGYPMRVENAHFKTVKVRGEKLINLSLEVVAFSLAVGGE